MFQGMGHKSSLAGLWAGGGKGLVQMPEDHKNPKVRENVFLDFGDFLTSLRGCYSNLQYLRLRFLNTFCNQAFHYFM